MPVGSCQSVFDDPHYSDVTLLLSDRIVYAHLIILKRNSPQFAALLNERRVCSH
jgi:hypothetical protein